MLTECYNPRDYARRYTSPAYNCVEIHSSLAAKPAHAMVRLHNAHRERPALRPAVSAIADTPNRYGTVLRANRYPAGDIQRRVGDTAIAGWLDRRFHRRVLAAAAGECVGFDWVAGHGAGVNIPVAVGDECLGRSRRRISASVGVGHGIARIRRQRTRGCRRDGELRRGLGQAARASDCRRRDSGQHGLASLAVARWAGEPRVHGLGFADAAVGRYWQAANGGG